MKVAEKLTAGMYEPSVPYPVAPKIQEVSVLDAINDPAASSKTSAMYWQKFSVEMAQYTAELDAYNELEEACTRQMYADLAEENGLIDHPKLEMLLNLALSYGSDYGPERVVDIYNEMAQLLKS